MSESYLNPSKMFYMYKNTITNNTITKYNLKILMLTNNLGMKLNLDF